MPFTDTRDISNTVNEIIRLEQAGCDIVRVAVVDSEAAAAIKEIKKSINIPLVADIHYDYRLAIESIHSGADKIRINPANISETENLKRIVQKCNERNIPMRIGINSGCMEKHILEKYQGVTASGMIESTLHYVRLLESMNFNNMVVAVKSSSVPMTLQAYRGLSEQCDYPLHLGVTETGFGYKGITKSVLGIGTLLSEGIGDTLRVSLTEDSVEEVKVGREILKALEYEKQGVQLIACPTCGRCQVNMMSIIKTLDERLSHIKEPIKVAVMGCSVNGPGEAREADIGIAGGKHEYLLFKKGEVIRKIDHEHIVEVFMDEIKSYIREDLET